MDKLSQLPVTFSVIGAGRVGRTLARVLRIHAGVAVVDVMTNAMTSACSAVQFIGAGTPQNEAANLRPAHLFLISVPDDQIASTARQLVCSGLIDSTSVVFHCSGALSATELDAAAQVGAAVASLHPIRSFADPAVVAESFVGTCFGVEGDPIALAVLTPLLHAAGARLVPILAESKTLYHAAAVFGANYLVTLLGVARDCYVEAGIPAEIALALLAPLARETIDNVFRLGPEGALTGPIARGDNATVSRQQQAVEQWDREHGDLYRVLAESTRRLAANRREPTS